MYYARYNFQANARAKAVASLSHSLRVPVETRKMGEWEDELKDQNYIYYGGELKPLASLSAHDKKEMIEDILCDFNAKSGRTKAKEARSNYLSKIKKAIKSETKKNDECNILLVDALKEIVAIDSKQYIDESFLSKFEQIDMARKKQKINMLASYIKAHNDLIDDVGHTKKALLQESIIKFPHTYNVSNQDVTKEEYTNFVKDFYEEYFPDYEIKLIAYHDDERSPNENSGSHPHIFVSTKNTRTGDFDLLRQQVKFINQYIDEHEPNEKKFPENRTLRYAEAQRFGEIFQRFMYSRVREKLLINKGIELVLSDEVERKSEARQRTNQEAKLRKSDRTYNHASRMQEQLELATKQVNEMKIESEKIQKNKEEKEAEYLDLKKEIKNKSENFKKHYGDAREKYNSLATKYNELVKEKKQLISDKDSLKSSILTLGEQAQELTKIYAETEQYNAELKEENQRLIKENHNLVAQVKKLKSFAESFTNKGIESVSTFTKKVFERMALYLRKEPEMAQKYMQDAVKIYSDDLPVSMRFIARAAADSAAQHIINDELPSTLEKIDGDLHSKNKTLDDDGDGEYDF